MLKKLIAISLFLVFPHLTHAINKLAHETAYLAGGCFWGMEELLRHLPGVISTEVGYTGGNPKVKTYELVKTGTTNQSEAVKVIFDPKVISYSKILEFFFRIHDPTTLNQQGNDKGTQYRSAIFYVNLQQEKEARLMREKVNFSGKWKNPVVTEVTKFSLFHKAEEYHQDYLVKNPGGYTCHWIRK